MASLSVPVWPITAKVSPCKEESHLKIGFMLLKGVHVRYTVGDEINLVYLDDEGTGSGQVAHVYDIKHVTLADLSKYRRLLKYFVDPALSQFMAIRQWLQKEFPGIIDGEIVTMVFYAITEYDEDLPAEAPTE